MSQADRVEVPLSEAAPWIRDGDLLLFRAHDLIAVAGRGEHCHAAKAAWWDDDLFCLETRQWYGGRAVTLSSLMPGWSGRIDVYETNPDDRWPQYDRPGAVRFMKRLCGCPYGWWNLIVTALVHLPGVRLWVRPDVNDATADRRPPYCSQACALADRLGGGVDPVLHLADRLTEPADLARSPFYRYRFTLTS